MVDSLSISTIDILKTIIEECNITGEIISEDILNVPRAKYRINIIQFEDLGTDYYCDLKGFIKAEIPANVTIEEWLSKSVAGKKCKEQRHDSREVWLQSEYSFSVEQYFYCSLWTTGV